MIVQEAVGRGSGDLDAREPGLRVGARFVRRAIIGSEDRPALARFGQEWVAATRREAR